MGRPRKADLAASDLSLMLPLGNTCSVKMDFEGIVTVANIDRLMEILPVIRKSLEEDGELKGRRKEDAEDDPVLIEAAS